MHTTRRTNLLILVVATFTLLLSACSEDTVKETSSETVTTATPAKQPLITPSASNDLPLLQSEISKLWLELLASALALKEQTSKFLQTPTPGNLEATLTIWEQTHSLYQTTRALDHLGLPDLPLEENEDGTKPHSFPIRLDQHPLLLGYLDEVNGYPQSGIIYSELVLDEATLVAEHQWGDQGYVAMGFHALKAILEGDPELNRTPSDRFTQKNTKENIYIGRRAQYTGLLSELILKDIQTLHKAWVSSDGHYYLSLRRVSGKQLRQAIETSIVTENELLDKAQEESNSHINSDTITLRRSFIASLQAIITPITTEATEVVTP